MTIAEHYIKLLNEIKELEQQLQDPKFQGTHIMSQAYYENPDMDPTGNVESIKFSDGSIAPYNNYYNFM